MRASRELETVMICMRVVRYVCVCLGVYVCDDDGSPYVSVCHDVCVCVCVMMCMYVS